MKLEIDLPKGCPVQIEISGTASLRRMRQQASVYKSFNIPLLITAFTIAILLLSPACSTIQTPIEKVFQGDVERAADLLVKYGSQSEQQCGTFLKGAFTGAKDLRGEEVNGLVSGAVKLFLLKRYIDANKDKFISQCSGLAAEIILQVNTVQ